MEQYDLTVIGAGPIGLNAALKVANSGYSVAVIERKAEIGYPNHCSGLVSPKFIQENSVSKELIIKGIKGALMHCGETDLLFKDNKINAYVIDRERFDKTLAEKAKKFGVNIFTKTYIKGWEKIGKSLILYPTGQNPIKTHILLIASGAYSGIKRLFGFSVKPQEIIHTIQVDGEIPDLPDEEIVYVFADNSISHNWFSWIIPLKNKKAHIGLGTDKIENMPDLLEKFISETPMLKKTIFDINKAVSWIIPIGLTKDIVKDNILVVGDAANQVKPFSGGGLHTGMIASELAAQTIVKALKSGDYTYETLSGYTQALNRNVFYTIKTGLLLREVYKETTDREKEEFLKSINNKKAKEIILKYGDIDNPIVVGKKLMKFAKSPIFHYIMEHNQWKLLKEFLTQ